MPHTAQRRVSSLITRILLAVEKRCYDVPMVRPVAILLVLSGCAAFPFEERRLATIPADARVIVPVSFSADGRRAAYVEQRGDSCRTVCESRTGKPYGIVC